MAGKQAKLLKTADFQLIWRRLGRTRHALRNRAMFLLSVKAGLRAGEIAQLTWPMVLAADGTLGHVIELHDRAAKKNSGRSIPMHGDIRRALIKLRRRSEADGPIIKSERGEAMTAASMVNWFAWLYRDLGLEGCTSHSGRRTFITTAARKVHLSGGSLRDVQELAGHKSISMTQRYIDGDTKAKRRLVNLI